MASNEFDSLIADLQALDRLRENGQLSKALAAPPPLPPHEQRERAHRQAIERIGMVRELVPSRPSKAAVRASVQDTMNKALVAFEAGQITALDVAKLEARAHRLARAAR